ncbi:MAG: cysteine hydrolase family protein [Methanoregula sp.]|jgi:nicotinamidase-related amidase
MNNQEHPSSTPAGDSESPHEAVLVIDVQNEYFTGLMPVTWPPQSFEKILSVMDTSRDCHIPIAVIQHTSQGPDAKTFRRGSHGWELHHEIRCRPYDILIQKTLPGSFTGTELSEWLISQGISRITIAGYMTQMCCDTTARQASHLGYSVQFLSDATGTLDISNAAGSVTAEELHRAICVTQGMGFSKVMTTREWKDRAEHYHRSTPTR